MKKVLFLTTLITLPLLTFAQGVPQEVSHDPDSSPAYLNSNAADTSGPGGIEIFLNNGCSKNKTGHECENNFILYYGIKDKFQVSFEKSFLQTSEMGQNKFKGYSASTVGVKYRFLEKNNFNAAIYPNFTFNDTTKTSIGSDPDDLENSGDGQMIYIPLILSKQIKNYTALMNIGTTINLDDPTSHSYTASLALGRALNKSQMVMGEIYSERNLNLNNLNTEIRIGWVKMFLPEKLKKYQGALFASLAYGIGPKNESSNYLGFNIGINVLRSKE